MGNSPFLTHESRDFAGYSHSSSSTCERTADIVAGCSKLVSFHTPTWIGDGVQEHTRPACILFVG
jgi:hypothetical protein